ncbi:MAG: hypothetical protein ABIF77_08840 [bacterium]
MIRLVLALLFVLVGGSGPAWAQTLRPFLEWQEGLGGSWLVDDSDTTVPSGWRIRVHSDLTLLLRERAADRVQDYRWDQQRLSCSWRSGDRWLAGSFQRDATTVRLDNVHTENDHLQADRDGTGWRLAAGRQSGPWTLQLGVGRSRDWEGDVSVGRSGRAGRWLLQAGCDRQEWIADQDFEGLQYRLLFPVRRERLEFRYDPHAAGHVSAHASGRASAHASTQVSTHASSDTRRPFAPAIRLLREVLKGEPDQSDGDYNRPFARRHRGELFWDRLPGGATFALAWEQGSGELRMFADEQKYLELDGLDFRILRAEAFSPPGPLDLRLGLSLEEQTFAADDGFFEPWPFSFWDVFSNLRYRIVDMNYRLGSVGVNLRRTFGRREPMAVPAEQQQPGSWLTTTLGFHWLSGGGDVHWEERVAVLWPFLFAWEPHHERLDLAASYLLRLDLQGELVLSDSWRLNGEVMQLVPLTRGEGDCGCGPSPGPAPLPDTGDGTATYGGLRVTLALEWRPSMASAGH